MRKPRGPVSLAVAGVLAMVIAAALPGAAPGATVTYRNDTTTFAQVNFPPLPREVSVITVPAGRPPVAKVELPGVKVSAPNPGGSDVDMELIGPAGTSPPLNLYDGSLCNTFSEGFPINFTDSGAPMALANCDGDRKPLDPRTLALYNGGPSSGTWTMSVYDTVNGAPNWSFHGWGLTITHAPLVLNASASKQKIRKKRIALKATCTGNCSVATAGDAKASTAALSQDQAATLKPKLARKALKRLSDGGKAKVKLTATNDIGDSVTRTLAIKIKDQ